MKLFQQINSLFTFFFFFTLQILYCLVPHAFPDEGSNIAFCSIFYGHIINYQSQIQAL